MRLRIAREASDERLSEDPRVERLQLRRELERTRARWRLFVLLALVLGLGVAQWQVGSGFAAPLAIAAAALGVAFDRWQSAVAADERIEQDVRTLTTIYHESPRTLRRWLTTEFIDDSIRNLLAAALDSDELANGYWKQGVDPFLRESARGFKADWTYQIDLADLADDLPLRLGEAEVARLTPASHRRLHTTVTYVQKVPNPPELYYIAAVFDGTDLPAWFKRPNFLLREVVVMPDELVAALPDPPSNFEELPTEFDRGPAADAVSQPIADLARAVLGAKVVVGESVLEPITLHVDKSGISWGFRLDRELRQRLQASSQIRVELQTFMSRNQRYFPVVIAAPTRNPTVQFNYALTDIGKVETEVFFSAERPWDPRLRTRHDEYRRIDVLTEPEDWVFAGSGCVFAWWQEEIRAKHDLDPGVVVEPGVPGGDHASPSQGPGAGAPPPDRTEPVPSWET